MAEKSFLRLPKVKARTGLSAATIYRRIAAGTFPSPVPLGSPHIVGWLESEIEDWCDAQVRAARPEPITATA
jgi:prophage regulatory protein